MLYNKPLHKIYDFVAPRGEDFAHGVLTSCLTLRDFVPLEALLRFPRQAAENLNLILMMKGEISIDQLLSDEISRKVIILCSYKKLKNLVRRLTISVSVLNFWVNS